MSRFYSIENACALFVKLRSHSHTKKGEEETRQRPVADYKHEFTKMKNK